MQENATAQKPKMNKKRVIIAVVAAVVLAALAVTGAKLLIHTDKTATGAIYGTMGVSSVPVPDNIDDLTFGISYSRVCEGTDADSGYASAGYFSVTNGQEITFYEPTETKSVVLNVVRYNADSSFNPDRMGNGTTVYTTTMPASMTWNLTDVLTTVPWEDGLFEGHEDEVEITFTCAYNDNCNGQFYITHVNVYSPEGINGQHYWVYEADFDLVTTS